MLDTIGRDEDKLLPEALAVEESGLLPEVKEGGEKRPQEGWGERVQSHPHLVVTGDVAVQSINRAEVVLFREGLFFEVEEGGRLEREHGKSGLENIAQGEARIAGAMVWEALKVGL